MVMVEAHLVPDPSGTGQSGPGGLTIALTEATASWEVFEEYLTLSGGLFWAPFGIVNWDWLGAQNLFTLIPRASGPFPTHYNERGFRANGLARLGERAGVNYVFSVGNGVGAFDISGQSSTDRDNDKTVVGRVGVFPGLGDGLEFGYSFSAGQLRSVGDPTAAVDDPARYASDFVAHGGDVTARTGPWSGRGYFILSRQDLAGAAGLDRAGAMVELRYRVHLGWEQPSLLAIAPKMRFDWAQAEQLDGTGTGVVQSESTVWSVGSDLEPAEKFRVSVEYHFQREMGVASLNNNRFIVRLTGQF